MERSEHMKRKIVAMNFEVPLMNMATMDFTLQQGNYEALFSFKLPNRISSSLSWSDKSRRERPEIKIEHKVKISLVGTGLKDKPKSKAEIVIRQRPV